MPPYTSSFIAADGLNIFYRSAGPPTAPILLLLHGFPSSSHQYRNLIPLLSRKYRLIAPDLPGFGFTTVPPSQSYQYTFANLASSLAAFLAALHMTRFAVYIFDYGAPVLLRLALTRKYSIQAIVSQNGNAYLDGLGAFWDPIRAYWNSGSPADRDALRTQLLSFDTTKFQYTAGTPAAITVAPETYTLDYHLLGRPGNDEVQLDLFYDYRTNVGLYPAFQAWLRETQTPVLAVWGRHDVIFVPPGAEAFKRDVEDAEVHLLDAGHFAVESHTDEIAELILDFLERKGI